MNWKNSIKGAAMGIVETVPGVSSSTIAMLLGIYEDLIHSINTLTTKQWKKGVIFLLPIGIGILVGAIASVLLISFFLEHYPRPAHYLFIGLIIGMLPFIWRKGKESEDKSSYRSVHFFIMAISFATVSFLGLLPESSSQAMENLTFANYIYLFFSGWLASVALVLPGISGALILMVVGAYQTALDAILALNIPIIFTLGIGVVVGILMTSKLVRFMLKNYRNITYSAMLGLIGGSIIVLYPGIPNGAVELVSSALMIALGIFTALKLSKE